MEDERGGDQGQITSVHTNTCQRQRKTLGSLNTQMGTVEVGSAHRKALNCPARAPSTGAPAPRCMSIQKQKPHPSHCTALPDPVGQVHMWAPEEDEGSLAAASCTSSGPRLAQGTGSPISCCLAEDFPPGGSSGREGGKSALGEKPPPSRTSLATPQLGVYGNLSLLWQEAATNYPSFASQASSGGSMAESLLLPAGSLWCPSSSPGGHSLQPPPLPFFSAVGHTCHPQILPLPRGCPLHISRQRPWERCQQYLRTFQPSLSASVTWYSSSPWEPT